MGFPTRLPPSVATEKAKRKPPKTAETKALQDLIRGSGKTRERLRFETALILWLKANKVSLRQMAKRLSVTDLTMSYLAYGWQLPRLILAFQIEAVTNGGVPVASWLATDLAQHRMNKRGRDWLKRDAQAKAWDKVRITRWKRARAAKKRAAKEAVALALKEESLHG